jgi:TPR repeat protein
MRRATASENAFSEIANSVPITGANLGFDPTPLRADSSKTLKCGNACHNVDDILKSDAIFKRSPWIKMRGTSPTALVQEGLRLEKGLGVPINLVAAAQHFKLAADQNHADGQNNYGFCLSNGRGVPIDLVAAAQYFKLAADQNHADGQFNYGFCLENGQGVPIDLVAAAQYFKLAADQNHACGQVNYANCLQNGVGLSRDLLMAARYYKRAADQGFGPGQFRRGT